jgi:LAO/AO transport system kinase
MDEKTRPEWVPGEGGKEFTTEVMKGVELKSPERKSRKKKKFDVGDYVDGVKENNLSFLSRTITLIESNSPKHGALVQDILKELLPNTGNSIRIGITGPPGAGKSTFIEALGVYLCNNGFKVAVLAVDPSSTVSRGSILGDKTRMEKLSRDKNAYIRPSASGGTLGGVARKTRETMLVCEAAGYDVILVETIGVGQSEITVRSMVDFFMLLLLPGSGDELQGIKKGVVELADLIAINKADGHLLEKARLTKADYANALRLLSPATEGWQAKVELCSALKNEGISKIWSDINEFTINTKSSGIFESRRKNQVLSWVNSMAEEEILNEFYRNPKIKSQKPEIEKSLLEGKITPSIAVKKLMEIYHEKNTDSKQ